MTAPDTQIEANALSGRDKAASEDAIYRDLVDTLFQTKGAFVAGLAAGMLGPVIAWFSTGELVYFQLLIVMSALAAFRIAVMLAYTRQPVSRRRADASCWERLYAIGGISFLTGVGVVAAILFTNHHTEMIAYYGVVLTAGFTASLASRNAARPWIVFGQTVAACAPLAIVCLLRFDFWYWGLTAILIIGMVSVRSTTSFLHQVLEAALRNGYDAKTQKRRFSLALNSMTHGLCMGDADLSITVVNRRIIEFFGIVASTTPIRLEALAHAIGKSANMPEAAIDTFVNRWKHHAAMPNANVFNCQIGERYFDFHCERAEAGAFVTVIEDVTAQKRALLEIERIARYDDLTGLPNRYQFQDTLTQELAQLRLRNGWLAVLNVDLDRFKEINDTLGHPVGDQLLVAVGERLTACVTPPHVVARLGGDEFCVLLRDDIDIANVEGIVLHLLEELHRPFTIGNHIIDIGASFGCAWAPADADTPNGLLKCSDLALYHSKDHGRGKAFWYTPTMQEVMTHKRDIETELRKALENDELMLFYQPVVDSRTRSVIALEALMRWRHPRRGMVSPAEFIPIAEETGIIVELGAWALSQACADALTLPPEITVSVNLAPRQFQQNNLVQTIGTILRQIGVSPSRLELEITESTLMMENDNVEEKLQAIQALGVRLALDDFGTGYSSLGYLNRFPVKKVKIDRSFSRQALTSQKTQAIIGAISMLARDLDMQLVAEGVETVEQLAFMSSKNIFLIQGYLYSQPRPLAELKSQIGAEFSLARNAA